ncbi:MAG: OmpA family protein [Cyclobacteriaceae bacterium]
MRNIDINQVGHEKGRALSPVLWLLLSLLLLLSSDFLSAQELNRANAYFEAQQFFKASRLYELSLEEDSTNYYAAYQLAHCYRKLFRYAEAERWYRKVADEAYQNFPLSLFYYAKSLKLNQKYQQAIETYEEVLKNRLQLIPADYLSEAVKEQQGCYQALLELAGSSSVPEYTALPQPLNSSYHEYAPLLLEDDSSLFFTSSRTEKAAVLSNRSGDGFPNIYRAVRTEGEWQLSGTLPGVNTRESEASGCLSADGRQFFFTRCDQRSGYCRIFVSTLKKGTWSDPLALNENINAPGSNAKHPALSEGGDTLIFVSDREGGRGGTDLWMSLSSPDGDWLPAVNLGPRLNTAENEVAPYFCTEEALLIFSSNGRVGLGGMDFYALPLSDLQQKEPVALLPPFNSSRDDAYLAVGKQQLFWSSNRKGDFDIYTLNREKESLLTLLTGESTIASVSTRRPIPFKQGVILPRAGENYQTTNLQSMRSARQFDMRNGSSRFVLSADVDDILLEQFRDRQAREGAQLFVSDELNEQLEEDFSERLILSFSTQQLREQQRAELVGQLNFVQSGEPARALMLFLLDESGQIIKISTTNDDGRFRFANLDARRKYSISTAEGSKAAEYRLSDVKVAGYTDDFSTLRYENIYFDFNQAYLRPEARMALAGLAAYYASHPDIVIEINAFTDSTGNDQYNLELSRRRGQSAFDYLLQQGVDRSSLVINAKGVSTAISTSNNFVSQQMNRRVEFYITGRRIDYEPEIVTRILRPDVTLEQLAASTGISEEEIRQLNGLSNNELQSFKPIRIHLKAFETAPQLFYQIQLRSE